MVSDERGRTASTGTEDKNFDQKIVSFSDLSKGQFPLSRRLTKADRFRGVTRSMVRDALSTLNKMADGCHESPELMENYYQLYHCLDYLKRFCDGKV